MPPVPEDKTICVVCARRENRQIKYFSPSSRGSKCPDYTLDFKLYRDYKNTLERKNLHA